MNFSEALELMKQGKKVRRSRWVNSEKLYLYLEDNEFWLATGEFAGTIGIHYDDILANDWEEYKKPLLTEEEKEYLKMVIKFSKYEIVEVSVAKNYDDETLYLDLFDESESYGDTTTYLNPNYFKNLEEGKHYTLKELGLDE